MLLNGIRLPQDKWLRLVDYALVPTQSWHLMFITGIIPAILFIGMLMLPASPRWIALRYAQSVKYLKFVRAAG